MNEEEILTITAGKTDPATGQTHVAQETVTRERPPTAVSIEYDLSGNRIRDSRWSYEYDGENLLIRMTNHPAYSSTQTEHRFVYDAEHRRVQKIILENGIPVDVTAFLFDDFKVIATLDSSGNPKQTFHWTHEGPGGLLALTDHRTSPRQTHVAGYDGRGNLTTLLNAADASLSAAYEYAPFGEVIRATGPYAPQNPFGFSTTWTDHTTHLNYYGYRFYHPAEGRFLNQDPIEEQGGNNLYAAFGGDPVNRWDFRGLSAIAISVPQRLDAIRESDIRTQFRAEVYELPPHTVRPYCPPGTVAINNWLGGVDCASTTGANFLQPYPGHQNGEGGGSTAAASPPAQQTETQKEELPPCSEVRQQLLDEMIPSSSGAWAAIQGAGSYFRGNWRGLGESWDRLFGNAQERSEARLANERVIFFAELYSGSSSFRNAVNDIAMTYAGNNWEKAAGRFAAGTATSYGLNKGAGLGWKGSVLGMGFALNATLGDLRYMMRNNVNPALAFASSLVDGDIDQQKMEKAIDTAFQDDKKLMEYTGIECDPDK